MNSNYSIVISDFFQSLLRIRRRRKHYHHSSGSSGSTSLLELLVLLAGASLIYIVFKTTLIEKIVSNELIHTIIKIILTLSGIGIIIFLFTVDKN